MMELGYQIFIELELGEGFEDEDPYIDGGIDKGAFLEIDNWSTSKGGKNSGICGAPSNKNNTPFEKLLKLWGYNYTCAHFKTWGSVVVRGVRKIIIIFTFN